MKLVIATAAAALLGISAAALPAMAQDAAPADGDVPALRAGEDADSATAVEPAADGPATPAEAGAAPVDPAARLAEARAAAVAAAAAPGAVSDPLLAKVADYALFQRDLSAIQDRQISEPEDLDAVMDALAAYEPGMLSDAFMAYGAFVGAQNATFVEKVREVADYYGVNQLVQGMINEPEYVLTFPGAREAANAVLRVVREDVGALTAMSERFKRESYDLQNRGWSNLIARDRDARQQALTSPVRLTTPTPEMLALVAYGVPSGAEDSPAPADLRRAVFWSAVDYRTDPQVRPGTGPAQGEAESIGVMMTLAALRTLEVSETRPDLVEHLLGLPRAEDCLDFARTHMRQCVSAAHYKYEDAFCIAEHQLKDMGECLAETVNPRGARAVLTPAMQASTEAAETAETAELQSTAN